MTSDLNEIFEIQQTVSIQKMVTPLKTIKSESDDLTFHRNFIILKESNHYNISLIDDESNTPIKNGVIKFDKTANPGISFIDRNKILFESNENYIVYEIEYNFETGYELKSLFSIDPLVIQSINQNSSVQYNECKL
jgi:hypothetical protein